MGRPRDAAELPTSSRSSNQDLRPRRVKVAYHSRLLPVVALYIINNLTHLQLVGKSSKRHAGSYSYERAWSATARRN
jgi:hypothetical protein